MMRWAFEAHAQRTFVLTISPTNLPSLAMAAALGFADTGDSQVDEEDGVELFFVRRLDGRANPTAYTRRMTTTLITGANKGLGKETARRLIAAGHVVWIGARDATRGQAAADELGARFVALDVTDDASVDAAVATLRAAGGLDVLINNAGIVGAMKPPATVTADDVAEVFATNVLGVVRVTQKFAPLLDASKAPVVVNVSSGLGSITQASDPNWEFAKFIAPAYCASKAALNMLTVQWAKTWPRWRVNAADPGYTATDLNNNAGPQTVEEGTDRIVALAQIGASGPTGTFSDRHGVVPW